MAVRPASSWPAGVDWTTGSVFDVPPGEITIAIDAPGIRCHLDDLFAFPGSNANQVRAVVIADTITTVSAVCASEL